MKIFIVSIVSVSLLILATGCATLSSSYDERLLGSWKSNKAMTLERLRKERPDYIEKLGKEKFKTFSDLFGKMVVTYTKNQAITRLGGDVNEIDYEVLDKGDDFVVIKFYTADSTSGVDYIKFDETGYWLKPGGSAFAERFDRIKSK